MLSYQSFLETILNTALEMGASDVHISVGQTPVLRIVKDLVNLDKEKKITAEDSLGLAFALMNEAQKQQFLQTKEIDFAYSLGSKARFRVNVFYQTQQVSIALRAVPFRIKTLAELNLPDVLNKFVLAQYGLVLIAGVCSQGKSTTLASLIDSINHQRREHIITIEDPIEYIFEDDLSVIEQREVGDDTLSFSSALRSVLREDPNVIMVGEMRDLETIATTITSAETGHLVFATLHTSSASQTIHRIIDVFPPHQQEQIRAQLAGSLLGVVTQRLVPKQKGGFVPACEVMFNNSAVANLIRENKTHEILSIIETSKELGMVGFNQSLASLVAQEKISPENALKYSFNPDELITRLRRL
ncbi:MAG: type IV pilus twitching motility protein PilT [Patescibacteria group bacterium]|nr:type IV pilus twitching motility protein PilT [Patescibacteria group bacterium]